MKRRKVLIIAGLIVFILILIYMWDMKIGYSSILKSNWGISLPLKSNYREIYYKDSGASFHGDGIRYHIFSYENEEHIKDLFNWTDSNIETIYNSSHIDESNKWLKEIEVPKEYYPNYDNCLYFYKSKDDNSEVIFFLDKKEYKIYVLESFM